MNIGSNDQAHSDVRRTSGGHGPDWIKDWLRDFHKIDCMSDMFRYAESPSIIELWVDLHQAKAVMDRLVEAFESYIASKPTARSQT